MRRTNISPGISKFAMGPEIDAIIAASTITYYILVCNKQLDHSLFQDSKGKYVNIINFNPEDVKLFHKIGTPSEQMLMSMNNKIDMFISSDDKNNLDTLEILNKLSFISTHNGISYVHKDTNLSEYIEKNELNFIEKTTKLPFFNYGNDRKCIVINDISSEPNVLEKKPDKFIIEGPYYIHESNRNFIKILEKAGY